MIIAVDFDGTLSKAPYPSVGEPNKLLFKYLIDRQSDGDEIILWTCRVGKPLDAAVDFCKEQGLTVDAVNENLPWVLKAWDNKDTRKVYADLYIDDKAWNSGGSVC